jgi:signal recognition particle subunit SEC65
METIIKKLQEANDICPLTEHIIAYDEYRKAFKCAALYQFGISPANKSSLATATGEAYAVHRENAILKQAETYLKNISGKEGHKERKESIESALRLLMGLFKERRNALQPQAFILIARAYLLRSLIIRQKGRTVPEKKKEALEKGLSFVDNAIEQLKSKASVHADKDLPEKAWRIKSQLYLEYHRVKKVECNEDTLKEVLENALVNGCNKFNEKVEDVQIAIRYCELENSTKYLEQLIASPLEGIAFEKARAYKLLGSESKIRENMRVVIGEYLSGFSDPLWDDAVEFINELKSDNKDCWKKLSLDIYESCREQEAETASLHLRWYWSRQRRLYDLAFIAAEKAEEKAKIDDSFKRRQ